MGLITLTNIEDGQDAVANALNERFGKIVDTVNGNIDSQNLKNNAVTREKIAPQSITSDKLLVEREYDQGGWLVSDYGGYKEYTRSGVANYTAPGNSFSYIDTGISFPAGCGFSDIVGSFFGVVDQAISVAFCTSRGNKVSFTVQNKYGQPANANTTWSLTFRK